MPKPVVLSEDTVATLVDLLSNVLGGEKEPQSLRELEQRHICRVLRRCGGNKARAAQVLGISVNTLYNRLHRYEVKR